jgi:type I restriction enzyme, R subunit
VQALIEAIEAAEKHLRAWASTRHGCWRCGLRPDRRRSGDAVDAVYSSDEAKRRFEIMARQVFIRFKAPV